MIDLLVQMNPGFVLIVLGALCAFIPVSAVRKVLLIIAPVLAAVMIYQGFTSQKLLPIVEGSPTLIGGQIELFGQTLTTLRIDNLAQIWGYVFCLAGIINGIYGLHEKCRITDSSALIYTGAAIAAVFCGDLLSLFIFWELTALSSVFIIWKGGERSYAAGMRYLGIQVLSGVLLLAGAVIYGNSVGNYEFNAIGLSSPGGLLILLAMGIKVGFPFLHNWIQDSYPKSSVVGTVILSAFTTKLAVYALARGFEGESILIYIGAIMTLFPVFFAVMENDLRKVLAYSLNNQLGFMVCGIGIGGALAMNGVAGQVVVHIIFKSLLFMSIGAVLYRVGTAKASELGGLFRSMPITAVCCMVGAASIAAFPFFAAFVTKAMIIASVLESGHYVVYLALLFASAGVMEHSGIKVPFFTFFSHDAGYRVPEAPTNMLVAMVASSILCIVLAFPIGGYHILYSLMPFQPVSGEIYVPYTIDHVVFQMQLLFAAMLAFALLRKFKLYPPERRAEILDFDWTYRRAGLGLVKWTGAMWAISGAHIRNFMSGRVKRFGDKLYQAFSPAGAMSESAPSGLAALLTALMLGITVLVIYFVQV